MALMTPFDVDIGIAIDGETGNGTDVDGSLMDIVDCIVDDIGVADLTTLFLIDPLACSLSTSVNQSPADTEGRITRRSALKLPRCLDWVMFLGCSFSSPTLCGRFQNHQQFDTSNTWF
jgi:hypothetical protein